MAIQVNSWYQTILGNEKKRAIYIKYASIVLGGAVILTGLFFSYRWYVVYRNRQAQAMLAEYIHKSQADSGMSLESIEALFQEGAQKQSGTYLEPYFSVFQANTLIKEDKLDDAIGVMEKAIAQMAKDNLLLPLFEVKHALMQLDSTIPDTNQAGLQKLAALAHDGKNQYADMALYFLGNHYWSANKLAEAQQVWQELIEMERTSQTVASSPWAQLAQVKLQQISA